MRYFSRSEKTIEAMLSVIGKGSIDELFSSINPNDRLKRDLALPLGVDELTLKKELKPLSIPCSFTSFLGAGATEHFVPEWVSEQLRRAEWYTSYTPYQPEVSQGTLQALFEFQTMVASLFGLPIANASMYDGATAMVEAVLMAHRLNKKPHVAIASTVHPEYREVLKTYLQFLPLTLHELPYNPQTGTLDPAELESFIKKNDCSTVIVQSPNFFGQLENQHELFNIAASNEVLSISVTTDLSALAAINPPGSIGADIAVGDGLGLLGGLSMGGPGVGLFAIKEAYLRQMPGRIVGKTVDENNQPGFVLTLSTREQHIRREKATSNICTNHSLMALALTMTLSAYGKNGFFDLGQRNIKKTLFFREKLAHHGIKTAFNGPHYNETVVAFDNATSVQKALRMAKDHHIIAGFPLASCFPELDRHLLVSTTELVSDQDIETLCDIFSKAFAS